MTEWVEPYVLRTAKPFRHAPIAVTDSGVGGLSILRELHAIFPNEDFVFFADQGHVPYGERTLDEIRGFMEAITRFLLAGFETPEGTVEGAKLLVIACNTASAAALYYLRETFPQLRFVGLEPAVKPAAKGSKTRRIGVIATAATFQGQLYNSLIDRFAQNVEVVTRACPEFVQLVERGGPFTSVDQRKVDEIMQPLREANIDQLVLGCTHFPFLTPLLKNSLGDDVAIVDPSHAVARQTQRLLTNYRALTLTQRPGRTIYLTTGEYDHFQRQLQQLLNIDTTSDQTAGCYALQWQGDHLQLKG